MLLIYPRLIAERLGASVTKAGWSQMIGAARRVAAAAEIPLLLSASVILPVKQWCNSCIEDRQPCSKWLPMSGSHLLHQAVSQHSSLLWPTGIHIPQCEDILIKSPCGHLMAWSDVMGSSNPFKADVWWGASLDVPCSRKAPPAAIMAWAGQIVLKEKLCLSG